jgi:hypothetical protein
VVKPGTFLILYVCPGYQRTAVPFKGFLNYM